MDSPILARQIRVREAIQLKSVTHQRQQPGPLGKHNRLGLRRFSPDLNQLLHHPGDFRAEFSPVSKHNAISTMDWEQSSINPLT